MESNGRNGAKRLATTRRVVLLAVPPVEELDLVAPLQAFGTPNRLLGAGRKLYSVQVAGNSKNGKIQGECGLSLLAHGHYQDVAGQIDSVLVICGVPARNIREPDLLEWLREAAASVRRVGSVCVGAYLLAAAGLLDGRRAAVQWKYAAEMAFRFPRVAGDPKPIWIQDANILAMSPRNLARVFTREMGVTPSQYLLQLRVEAARRLLEQSSRGLAEVAAA